MNILKAPSWDRDGSSWACWQWLSFNLQTTPIYAQLIHSPQVQLSIYNNTHESFKSLWWWIFI